MSRADDDATLREIFGALEMPPHGLAKWFAQNRAFCEKHGGRRVYPELLALLDACEGALRERQSREGHEDR